MLNAPSKFGSSLVKKGKRKVQGVPQSQTAALPRPKRKKKPTNLNKHKPNKRTKRSKISSLFPKRGHRNTRRTEKHKNKMTHGKKYNKSPRKKNKATKSKTNTGTTALERSVPMCKKNKTKKKLGFMTHGHFQIYFFF